MTAYLETMKNWADVDRAWSTRAVMRELRKGAWIEPGGSTGNMLVSPDEPGWVPLRLEWVRELKRKHKLRTEWYRAGWGRKIKRTHRVRYLLVTTKTGTR